MYIGKKVLLSPVFWYNKSIEKSTAKSVSLCLLKITHKGVTFYVYYSRKTKKSKAGADRE